MTSLTAAQFPSAMLQPRLLPWMTQSQMNRAKSNNGSEPEAMMVPTPVPITEMMPQRPVNHPTERCGAKNRLNPMRCQGGWVGEPENPA